ncbi:MAG: GspH/FimT family pseudopilin [Betaproteobacteria bacterium]
MPRLRRRGSAAACAAKVLRVRHAPRAGSAAFTLVEMLIGLSIAALLIAMAVPAFHDWLGAYELANHARNLAETMTRARTEAVRRGHRVSLCKSPGRDQCADLGSWDAGFVVFADANHDGKIDPGEPVLEIAGPAPRGITVAANRPLEDYVSYTSLGQARMLNGALQMGTLTVCRSGQLALNVVLANSGRVRVEKTADRCP